MAIDKNRLKRKKRIRKKISGTSERPRISVYKSNKHIYAQLVDDALGKSLVTVSSQSLDKIEGNKTAVATEVGAKFGQKCKEIGVEKVVFDRNGFPYHGRVKALASAIRENGLSF